MLPRHAELADFLRTRRVRLTPAAHGLPSGARRRTAGLRREEVAQLAQVSTTWYTWLEQGRPVTASVATLDRVASALRLDAAETAYLHALARRDAAPARGEALSDEMRAMLDAMGANAAYVTNHCWDVLAWSPAACASFIDYSTVAPSDRNVILDLFTNSARRTFFVDWEAQARIALARFRVSYGRHANDARFARIVERAQEQSEHFRAWWARHEVQPRRPGTVEVVHPVDGARSFTHVSFAPGDAGDLRLTIYTPAPAASANASASSA